MCLKCWTPVFFILLNLLVSQVSAQTVILELLSDRACDTCHVTSGNHRIKNPRILLASQSQLCADCHPSAIEASHPLGVVPRMKLPAIYPLDWNNELTCSSCHKIHHPVHGELRGKARGIARGRDFCLSCHDTGFFDRMADMGSSLVISGHLAASTTQVMDLVDPFSLQCMGCHDEKGEIPISIDINGITRHASNGLNHPIGNNYTVASSLGGLHPQVMLNPLIDLPEGRVSCISCHSGYSAQHGMVKSVAGGGGLCLECHDL